MALVLRDILKQVDPDGYATVELMSGRAPRVVKGDVVVNLSRDALTDDEVLELCAHAGAGPIVDRVGSRPESWTFQGVRGLCVGTLVQKGREVLATFTAPKRSKPEEPAKRPSSPRLAAQRAEASAPAKAPGTRRDSKPVRAAERSRSSLPPARRAATTARGMRGTTQPPSNNERPSARATARPVDPTAWNDRVTQPIAPQVPASARDGKTKSDQPRAKLAEALAAQPEGLAKQAQVVAPPPPRSPEPQVAPAPAPRPQAEQRPPQVAPQASWHEAEPRPGQAAQPAQPPPAAKPAAGKLVLDVVLAKYLNEAKRLHASDLHLSVGTRPEARLGTGLQAFANEPLSATAMDRMLSSLLSGASRSEFEQSGAACFAVSVEGQRLRVNASETLGGKKIAVRLLDETARDLTDLGLPAEVEQAVSHHQGLVLVTGPAGQGKTTTLAALVELVNSTRACHIITVEDPVEILFPSKRAMVSQREVHTHTKSFERALKGALRQDPDVIVVGELRDATTVRMALSASETGHLVIGTMNTPSTTSTIDRLIDLFPPSDQPQVRATLSSGLRLVLNQRLVPRAGGGRRVVVCELLPGSLALSNLIREDKLYQLSSLMQRGRGAGILRMAESASELVRAGLVRKEDIEHLLPREHEREAPAPEPFHAEPPPLNEPDSEPPDGLGGLLTRAGAMFRRGGQ